MQWVANRKERTMKTAVLMIIAIVAFCFVITQIAEQAKTVVDKVHQVER